MDKTKGGVVEVGEGGGFGWGGVEGWGENADKRSLYPLQQHGCYPTLMALLLYLHSKEDRNQTFLIQCIIFISNTVNGISRCFIKTCCLDD